MKHAPDFTPRGGNNAATLVVPISAVRTIIGIVAVGAFTSAGLLFKMNAKLDAMWTLPDQIESNHQAESKNHGWVAPDAWEVRQKTRQ